MARLLFFMAALLLPVVAGCASESGGDGLASGADVVFADAFVPGESGDWFLEGDESGQASIIDEHLLIEVNVPNTVQYTALEKTPVADFVLEVDASQLSGSLDSSYGVLFRLVEMADGAGFYRFEITGNGEFIVERHNPDGSWTRLTDDWQFSPALNQGLNVTNRLGIRAVGDTFSFYGNDMLLAEVSDSSYEVGLVALDAGTFGQPGLQVAFDNFVVRRP